MPAPHEGLPVSFGVRLPEWLRLQLDYLPRALGSAEERMDLVNALARRNVDEGTGGPFAALVVDGDSGRVLAAGVNLVLGTGLSSAHAEVVTLSLAQSALGTWNLGSAAPRVLLSVNAQPCAMCFGALLWSGVRELEFAALGPDVERLTGFDEGPVPAGWRDELAARGIELRTGVREPEAHEVLAHYGRLVAEGQLPLYNGR
ncbi:nucleoside deaminase [Sediminivirga luteola]|uniref:tRNA-specific adenosine deaminase n=1 Tax=Sediminivirga luteola TaxID=1774748 RepID=A0A8J2TZK8_9MICO|nr:nucleoside deaminase [Sediminivirga luteola]MCI2266903.1 nucleoside deaminase [Sediminivirga luteola]GGA21316.1 tRNA-specific adenosine deaminase [Sediminivirga luteola]